MTSSAGRLIVAGLVIIAAMTAGCASEEPVDRRGAPAVPVAAEEPAATGWSAILRPVDQLTSPPRTTDALEAAVAVRVIACRPVAGRGAGLMVAPGRVLTSAHVVAGATSIQVVRGGLVVSADVVAFDPVNDLAVLDVPAGVAPYLPLGATPPDGSFDAEVVLFRDDRPVVESARVVRRVTINTEDIYRGGAVSRPGYELRAHIATGDSGAVLIAGGEAIAVVWSRSRETEGRAWAIDPIRGGDVVLEQLASGSVPGDVDLRRCA